MIQESNSQKQHREYSLSDEHIKQALADTFGFHSFRPHQEEIVQAILQGRDAFAVMPTGGGKSLCYQLPACLLKGVCVVVSPLISLMKDQVDAATANGLRAATLNSMTSECQRREIGNALKQGAMDLLYISPERFNSEYFIERLKTLDICFFAVDEAHCISEWGHDFRPDYLALSRIIGEFPNVPVAAFTATATARVAADIVSRLGLRNPHRTRASFNRPNLFYRIEPKRNINEQLREFVSGHPDESGIIYRTSRKKVEETAAMLKSYGCSALPYHAGMMDRDRQAAQEAFRLDECSIIVATIAFGMGIDKSNVRYVIHADLPKNIEGYYQETGRSGRDGAAATCVLYFGRQDVIILEKFAKDIEDAQAAEIARSQLAQMVHYATHDGCRRSELLRYFGEHYPDKNCGQCDFCTDGIQRVDATIPAQKILSAIYRTEERFGAVHICDIVVGADTEKIREFRHDKLPTFGVGKDRPKKYWRSVVDSLLAQEILRSDDPKWPILKLTDEARLILKGKRTFEMVAWQEASEKQKSPAKPLATFADLSDFGVSLFEELKTFRRRVAHEENMPSYVIFSDRTLLEIATYIPRNEDELLQVNGISSRKLAAYGKRVVEIIAACCQRDPAGAERARHARPEREGPVGQLPDLAPTHSETIRLFEMGRTIDEMAVERALTKGTIISHLEKAAQSGYEFELSRFFTVERFQRIVVWFQESGAIEPTGITRLKPAVDASAGELDYDEARLARMFMATG